MISNIPQYQVRFRLVDAVLEEEQVEELPHSRLGCFLQYDGKFVDALMLKDGAHQIKPNQVAIPLLDPQPGDDPKLTMVVKDIQNDEPYSGSLSIARSIILEGDLNTPYVQWLTLFDDQGDDEYDGAMGLNDDEEPRIQVEFLITEVPKAEIQSPEPEYVQPRVSNAVTEPEEAANRLSEPEPFHQAQVSARNEEPEYQQPAAIQKQESGKRLSTAKSSKSYMNPIHNVKGKKDSGVFVAPESARPPVQAPRKTSNQVGYGRVPAAKPATKIQPTRNSEIGEKLPSNQVAIAEIQEILNKNPTKRQNVAFLKQLLDKQLGLLVNNLKAMQNDNQEIELETIQRLQLIEKFGNDANENHHHAQGQHEQLEKDLANQQHKHENVLHGQNLQKLDMQKELKNLEVGLHQLKGELTEAQELDEQSKLEMQEKLQSELNSETAQTKQGRPASPRKLEEIESQRRALQHLQDQNVNGINALRDLKRQIPSLAADFAHQQQLLSGKIDLLIEQNSELQGEIICLMEEKKSQKLIGKLEDEKTIKFEFEIEQLKTRAAQAEKDMTMMIEKGDEQYNLLRDEVKDQDEEEAQLSADINQTSNRDNVVLRSKLGNNKGDMERLKNISNVELGSNLEKKVDEQDRKTIAIVETKKNAHKGLIDIRSVMKTNIGLDQNPLNPDLSQVHHACDLLDEKEGHIYSTLGPQKDQKTKEYLANAVQHGLKTIMYSDKVDIEQHIEFNQTGLEKLQKIITKQTVLKQKQEENLGSQVKQVKQMDEQLDILKSEKQDAIKEIEINKEELERLKVELNAKKAMIGTKEEDIANIDHEIDQNFDEMEGLETQIAEKDQRIRELENFLNQLLNRKPEPQRPMNQVYIPVKGDEIDERLAEYINTQGSPVPWKRISQGNYTYGSKKISVKYMRMHLIIKVGGGSMMVEEFVANYEDIELAKMNYQNPGSGIQSSNNQGLSKQQKVALARGATDIGSSPRGAGSFNMGSPKARKTVTGVNQFGARSGSGGRV